MKKVGEYIVEELVGSGTFGEVYRGSSTEEPGKHFAIKMIAKKNIPEKVFKYLEREVEILQMTNHPNIVKLIDIRATENHYYIVLEYCNGGDLSTFRKNKGGTVSESVIRFILKQLMSGLNEVHTKNAIHRDIKLSNVLLCYPDEEAKAKQQPVVKLGDFGFAKLITQLESSEESEPIAFLENLLNAAPEIVREHKSSFKSDIWSLGTIVYELLCGRNCYSGIIREELVRNIDKALYHIPKQVKLSLECLDFLNACLQFDVDKRIEWKDLLSHSFITTNNMTEFPPETFRKLNKIPKDLFEQENSYVLSSKVRYTFFETLKEGNKLSMSDTVDAEDEYIKVDASDYTPSKVRSIESSGYVVLSTLERAPSSNV
eukprot:TRINITY_DN1305_c0_g2_i1.p1 TRINITY_DN1305_c0_g2~~TRINITY_DN1305_c0_g2_i1.p1  ORF type:complete len:373 (-),score=104.39 TRINITY_DN1305_c0_g2_i1:105-1223(-)